MNKNIKRITIIGTMSFIIVVGGAQPAEAISVKGFTKMVKPVVKFIKKFDKVNEDIAKMAGKYAKQISKQREAAVKAGKSKFASCAKPTKADGCRIPEDKRASSYIARSQKEELAKRNGMTVEQLDRKIRSGEYEIDHILPRACGGQTHIDNLQLLTRKENRSKKDFNKCTEIPVEILGR